MRCLVTGADGFLGSHLVEALLRWNRCEHVVALVHRPPVKWLPTRPERPMDVISGDVTRTSSLGTLPDVDVVFHLAAIASPSRCEDRPELARITNFQGTVNMLNRTLEMSTDPVFVYVSSAALYGEPEYVPIDEEHPIEPRDQYTYGKMSAEITVMSYHRDQGLPGVIVRPFNVYGPRQAEEFVVPTIITQCLQGIELRLGDGRPVRNFTYVTDAVDMLARAGRTPSAHGRMFNLGDRRILPISRIVDMIVDITGCGLEPIYDPAKFREDDPTILEMDPHMAEKLLGWRREVPIEVGLQRTVEFYRAQMEARLELVSQDLYGSY